MSNPGPRIALHARISGKVQGVGYRAWVEAAARERGLAGWVRNRRDGTVEAVFSGPAGAVDAMIESCRRGPASARVSDVETRAATGDDLAVGPPSGFHFLKTV